ncbi:hypothetical protein SK128_025234, partial [Halocaridina rubra]
IHEKVCCGAQVPALYVPPSPDPEPVDDDPQPAGQVPFLDYFGLWPAEHTGIKPYMSPRKRSCSPPTKFLSPAFQRFDTVPFTSPLGRFLLSNAKIRNKHQASQPLVLRYERHLHATPHTDVSSRERGLNRWIVVWRPNKEEQAWVHLYCFNKVQRRERRITIQTGLNLRSRRLLAMCHPVRVNVKRLQKRVIDRITRLNGPMAPCIDLTDDAPGNIFSSSSFSDLSLVYNGNDQRHQYLPQVFTSAVGTSVNSGASSSSLSSNLSQHPFLPSSSSQLFLDDYHLSSELKKLPAGQCVPIHFSPGDIIKHNSLSIYPVTSDGLDQTSVSRHVSNQNSTFHPQPKNRSVQSETNLSRGPLSSKRCIKKQTAVVSSQDQQSFNRDLFSNNDHVLHLGNKDLTYNVMQGGVKKASTYSVCSTDLSKNVACVEKSTISQNQYTASLRVKNSQSVPRVPDGISSLVPTNENALEYIPHHKSLSKESCIEVIDLSSDDDDAYKAQGGYGGLENDTSFVEGVAYYPHSGERMPGSSSSISLPKNGNSHWSSEKKSHCDVGHLGDLTTNGQTPNVLRNPATYVAPSSHCPDDVTESVKMKAKKQLNSHLCNNKEILVFDISNTEVKVSHQIVSQESHWNILDSTQDKIQREEYCGTSSAALEPCYTAHSFSKFGKHFQISSDQCVDLHCSERNNMDVNILSYKDHSHNIYQRTKNSNGSTIHTDSNCPTSTPSMTRLSFVPSAISINSVEHSQSDHKNCVYPTENNVRANDESVANYADSLLPNDDKVISKDKNVTENDSEKMENYESTCEKVIPLKTLNCVKQDRAKEISRLLGDECRELKLRGLEKLRAMNIELSRVTRNDVILLRNCRNDKGRSVTRDDWAIPKSSQPKVMHRDKSNISLNPDLSNAADIITAVPDYYLDIYEKGLLPSQIGERNASCSGLGMYHDINDNISCSINSKNNNSPIKNNNCLKDTSESFKESTFFGKKNSEFDVQYPYSMSDFTFQGNLQNEYNLNVVSNAGKNIFSREKVSQQKWEMYIGTDKCVVPFQTMQFGLSKYSNCGDSTDKYNNCLLNTIDRTTEENYDMKSRSLAALPEEEECRCSSVIMRKVPKFKNGQMCQGDVCPERDEIRCIKVFEGGGVCLEMMHVENVEEKEKNNEKVKAVCEKGFHQTEYDYPRTKILPAVNACGNKMTSKDNHKKPFKKKNCIPRELRNLARDEWKELRTTGFHPSNVVGSENAEISYYISDSDEDVLGGGGLLDSTQAEPSYVSKVMPNSEKRKKFPLEVLRLLKDECKELKRMKNNHRNSSKLKRISMAVNSGILRKGTIHLSKSSDTLNLIMKYRNNMQCVKPPRKQILNKVRTSLSTRSQSNSINCVEVYTLRGSHRYLLETEFAMCVLNYDIPSLT